MKSILIVSTSYPNSRNAASGVFVQNLAKAIGSKSAISSVAVIAPSVAGIETGAGTSQPVPVRYFRYAPNSLEVLAQLPGGIPAALRANPFTLLLVPAFLLGMFAATAKGAKSHDVVLAQWSVCGLVAGLACAVTGTTVVTTLHGEDVRNAFRKPIYRLILKLAIKLSAKIVCVSQEMKAELIDLFPDHREKYRFISNGVADELLDIRRTSPSPSGSPLRVILVGSLIPIKSVDHALESMKRLAGSEGCSITLTVVGDGYLLDDLRAQVVADGLEEVVNFLGVVDQAILIEEYQKHDLLLVTSKEEGRSTVVLEAMAASLAVVGSNVKGVREILAESPGGLLFDYGDIDQLCGLLRDIYVDRERAVDQGERNQRWIRESKLSWSEIANEYLALVDGY
jgi:glycosyltransferase involved in cell wall biosynthesis